MGPKLPLSARAAALPALFLALFAASAWVRPASEQSEMVGAARALLGALSEEQRARAMLSFDGDERLDWRFVPGDRGGVPIGELDTAARDQLTALFATGLSARGIEKVEGVLTLEGVLRGLEGPHRDPGRYFLAVWGVPTDEKPWGWRLEGHHLSLQFSVASADGLAATPFFVGANPARVASGEHAGLRLLGPEEDAARAFAAALPSELRERARIPGGPPGEVTIGPGKPASFPQLDGQDGPDGQDRRIGVSAAELGAEARSGLIALAERAVRDLRADRAEAELERLRASPVETITFAWAGALEPGEAFDWRVTWGSLAFEQVALAGNPAHVHSVWRDRERDFGGTLLAPSGR